MSDEDHEERIESSYDKLIDDIGNLSYYAWAVSHRVRGYLRDHPTDSDQKKEVKAHVIKSYKRILKEYILPTLRSLDNHVISTSINL
jgi:hypothetical protein